ncbi:hypothetical protein PCK2_000382, partial [Pneumocystis canis]
AGIDKGKRTKILEKEILIGEHEKVQGGYGKYQGTWIPFERGVEFCRQYGVEQMLWPILSLDLSMDNQNNNTPTKEQALALRRKQSFDSLDNKRDVPLKLKPSYATYPSSLSSMTSFNKPKSASPKHGDYVLMELHNSISNYNSTLYSNNQIATLNNLKTNDSKNVEESSKKHSEYSHELSNNMISPNIARKQYPAFTKTDLQMDNKPSEPLDQKNAREEFYNEMHKKQASIDIVYGQLRDATRILAELRKDLENSRKRARYLADIQQKCKNVERVINEETLYFYKHYSDPSFKMKDGLDTISDVIDETVDPDAPFFVDISLAEVENEDSPSFISISVLSARIAAYQKNAKVLCALATSLRGRSSELEDKCRKVVSLCTGVEENKVDSLLEGLLQAVESDNHQGVDMVRLSGIDTSQLN